MGDVPTKLCLAAFSVPRMSSVEGVAAVTSARMRARGAPVGVDASVSVLSSVSCLSPPFLSPSPTGPAGDAEQTHGNAYIVVADGRSRGTRVLTGY